MPLPIQGFSAYITHRIRYTRTQDVVLRAATYAATLASIMGIISVALSSFMVGPGRVLVRGGCLSRFPVAIKCHKARCPVVTNQPAKQPTNQPTNPPYKPTNQLTTYRHGIYGMFPGVGRGHGQCA